MLDKVRLCQDPLPYIGSDEAMVSFVLDKEEQEDSSSVATKFTIILRDANGSVVKESTIKSSHIFFQLQRLCGAIFGN